MNQVRFGAHGDFSVAYRQNVMVMCLLGSFNLEGAHALFARMQTCWVEMGRPVRWATLTDLRDWEGGTLDAFSFARTMQNWAAEHGAVAGALLFSERFMEQFLTYHVPPLESPLKRGSFCDETQALAWLETEGFPMSQP